MTIKLAVILAAGMGTRLKELGVSRPKGFLQLGDHPIIIESITKLLNSGTERIVIVTGHLAKFYEELKTHYSQITTIHNPLYATSGSMYSLYCARELIDADFLLLESDLIYEQRAISIAIKFPQNNVVILSGKTNAGDEVYVETSGDTITAMSKNFSNLNHLPTGELVGICKISLPLFERMIDYAKTQFTRTLKVDYETNALVGVAQSYPVHYTLIPDLLWAEIDTTNHLSRAKEQVYPNIGVAELRYDD